MWQTKFGRCIYNSPSGLQVYENLLYRWLTFGNTTLQSLINKRLPHHPMLHYLPALSLMAKQDPGSCCLLGLGGAGILHMLSKTSGIKSFIAVDNNKEVIEVAKEFFLLHRIPNLSLVHANGLDYLSQNSMQYQHLILDLYNATSYPSECASENFFYKCQQSLKEQGYLAINLANPSDHWPIFQTIKQLFGTTLVIPIKKTLNLVIIASKNPIQNQPMNTKVFKAMEWTKKWGYVAHLL